MSFIPTERTALGLKRRWLRQLSLRHKAWLLTAAVLVALMVVLSLGVNVLIRRSFASVEQRALTESVERVREIFRQQSAAQQRMTYDYAVWDDTYRYLEEPFEDYRSSNFSPAVLRNLQVNAALLFHADGRLALGYNLGREGEDLGEVDPVWITRLGPIVRDMIASGLPGRFGFLPIGDELLQVSAHQVLRSDETGAPRGCFVHLAKVDEATIAHVAEVARESLLPRSWKVSPGEAALIDQKTTPAGDRFAIEENPDTLRVGVWLPRFDGGRIALVELEAARDVLQEARRAMKLFNLVLLVVLIVSGVLIARALRWLVLQRLERIHAGVAHVGETADLSMRLPERRGDELDGLALGFNRMLDALEQARHLQERAEMEREQLREHLLHAKKMEAIGTLAGGIAHDFNNLITGLMGSIDLVRFGLHRGDPAHEHLDRMEQSAQRASALVRQLLALGRSQGERRVPLHLADVVADCLRLAQSGLPGAIDLRFRNEAMDDRIVADAAQLQQVVMNLVTNASHAMADQPSGQITVTIAAVSLPDAGEYPETALLPPGRYLRLGVTDTGRGVPEQIQPRIFDPFFTTKPVGSGSGLGLAVAHGFATKHQGAIGVRSCEGQGATFTLHLPCPPDEQPSSESNHGRRPLRVMLVDDDLLVRATLGKGLARSGHVVTEAGSARAALRLLKESPNGFDAIVTDQLMPGMTGLELMKRVSGSHPELPVVLISGYMTNLDAAEASEHPHARLLRKPVSLDELDRTVRAVVPGAA